MSTTEHRMVANERDDSFDLIGCLKGQITQNA
jgi:hypothetical protein